MNWGLRFRIYSAIKPEENIGYPRFNESRRYKLNDKILYDWVYEFAVRTEKEFKLIDKLVTDKSFALLNMKNPNNTYLIRCIINEIMKGNELTPVLCNKEMN